MSRRKVDTRMHSSLVFDGLKQTPSRAMLRAVGFTRSRLSQAAGRRGLHLEQADAVQHAHRPAGGGRGRRRRRAPVPRARSSAPSRFPTASRWARPGMRYSLVSREVIADSIETVVGAQGFDGLVAIGGCDKNMPGCMMAIARLNRPAVFVYGGTIRPGEGRRDIVSVFEAVGARAQGAISERELRKVERTLDPRAGQLRRHVHRQHHGVGDRGARHEPGEQLGAGGGVAPQARRRGTRRACGGRPDPARHPSVRHPDARGVRERDRREHRAVRLDERRAASACDRACGRGAAGPRRLHAHRQPRPGAGGSAAFRAALDVGSDPNRWDPAAHAHAARGGAAPR